MTIPFTRYLLFFMFCTQCLNLIILFFLRVCSEAFQLIFQEEINFDKIQPF